jgi:hypothetical protein
MLTLLIEYNKNLLMKIIIKTIKGEAFPLEVEPTTTILEVK